MLVRNVLSLLSSMHTVRPNLLIGPVVDQAALHGLLKKVRDLGMPLLSVNRINPGQADASDVKG
jgi:hypothetical protein